MPRYPIVSGNSTHVLVQHIEQNLEFRLDDDYNNLNLMSKDLIELPQWFGNIANHSQRFRGDEDDDEYRYTILKIDLSLNHLTYLPSSIGKFHTLKNLNLGFNNLISLPNSIGNLQSLEVLRLDNNQLSSIPDVIGRLQFLQTLSIQNNGLLYLPESITRLRNLSHLHVNGNYLEEDSFRLLDRMNIQNIISVPQKEFIWPAISGIGGVTELNAPQPGLYLGEDGKFSTHLSAWKKEFNPKGKNKISAIRK